MARTTRRPATRRPRKADVIAHCEALNNQIDYCPTTGPLYAVLDRHDSKGCGAAWVCESHVNGRTVLPRPPAGAQPPPFVPWGKPGGGCEPECCNEGSRGHALKRGQAMPEPGGRP